MARTVTSDPRVGNREVPHPQPGSSLPHRALLDVFSRRQSGAQSDTGTLQPDPGEQEVAATEHRCEPSAQPDTIPLPGGGQPVPPPDTVCSGARGSPVRDSGGGTGTDAGAGAEAGDDAVLAATDKASMAGAANFVDFAHGSNRTGARQEIAFDISGFS